MGRWLVAVLAAWAVAATGLLGWTVYAPQGPTAVAVWDADAGFLRMMSYYFESASENVAAYVAGHNDSFWENATEWIVAAINVAIVGNRYGPGGFPSAAALNLTWTRLQECAYSGFVYRHVYNDTSVWAQPYYPAYFTQTGEIYRNLSVAIRVPYAPGTDPLASLGPLGVACARQQADRLYALNEPFEGSVACGRP